MLSVDVFAAAAAAPARAPKLCEINLTYTCAGSESGKKNLGETGCGAAAIELRARDFLKEKGCRADGPLSLSRVRHFETGESSGLNDENLFSMMLRTTVRGNTATPIFLTYEE